MWTEDDDAALRREAMAWLAVRTDDQRHYLSTDEIGEFRFRGERFPLMDRQRGIRKPAQLQAALSIRTTFRPDGAERPYEDALRPDGLISYKWRGTDPDHPENRGLRRAYEQQLPLIWFYGVGVGTYQAVFPVFIVAEDRALHEFVLSPIEGVLPQAGDTLQEEVLRRYVAREAKHRLHQPIFRGMVLRAYGERCSVCELRHAVLLDAAHIVPDSDRAGIAAVRNGLSLCKIHHAAYDTGILGIRPDYTLAIREEVLREVDGPMLRHGLQDMHGQRLRVLPRRRSEKPDPDLLEMQWDRFLAS
ncbi:HNH endonuclease [Barrientosiimonas humi]|nr:HNH endonuclease [Barrientosiimonas humi]